MPLVQPAEDDVNLGGSFRPSANRSSSALEQYAREGDSSARYGFAREYCVRKRVLDYGCGFGLGAGILRGSFDSYLGIDPDPDAIAFAKNVVAPRVPQTSFGLPGPASQQDQGEESFDTVLCFEVVEHVRDPHALLDILARKTRPGGQIILSSPNGARSRHDKRLFWNPYHVDEYTVSELASFLERGFKHVDWFCEYRFDQVDRVYSALSRRRGGRTKSTTIEPICAAATQNHRCEAPERTTHRSPLTILNEIYHKHLSDRRLYSIEPLAARDFSKLFFLSEIAVIRV